MLSTGSLRRRAIWETARKKWRRMDLKTSLNGSPPFYLRTKGRLVIELGLQGPGRALGHTCVVEVYSHIFCTFMKFTLSRWWFQNLTKRFQMC